MYLDQIVPAPQGWTLHGNPVPGEEIYYASDDGSAQVFPHPDRGWELQFGGGEISIHVKSPQAAFSVYDEIMDDGTDYSQPPVGIVVGVRWHTFRENVAEVVQRIRHSRKDNGPFTDLYEQDLRALLASRPRYGKD